MRNERVIIVTDTTTCQMMPFSSMKYMQKRFPEWKSKMWKIGEDLRDKGEANIDDRYIIKRLPVNA